jgi:hypothetical protein
MVDGIFHGLCFTGCDMKLLREEKGIMDCY